MKLKNLKLFLLTIISGILFSVPAMAIPTTNFNQVNSPNSVGDTFDIEIWADGDNMDLGLLFFGFDVGFDKGGIFNYTGYTLGSAFSEDDSLGSNNVAAFAFPAIAENQTLLATLSFSTSSLGSDTLRITGLYDGLFSGLYYELMDGELIGYDINSSLTITTSEPEPSPVPESSTVLLLSAGFTFLSGMGLRQKKFNRQD
jgi:hypothetical protein